MATVGIDLTGTNVHVLVLGDDDEQLASSRRRTPVVGDRDDVVDLMVAAVDDAREAAGLDRGQIAAAGLGTPGVVEGSTVGGATNLPDWYERFPLADMVSTRLDLPVRLVNDVSAATVGEHRFGVGRGVDDLLGVSVGTGVGGGLVLGGQLYEGAFGGAGEFGHTVVKMGGAVCPCGRRGCVEAYAGRQALVAAAERADAAGRPTILFRVRDELGLDRVTSSVLATAYERGDEVVADLLDDAVDALGAGIASAVNLLDVAVVALGGALTHRLGPRFLREVRAATFPRLFVQPPHVEIEVATTGDEAGALGAAVLARALS